MPTSNSLDSNYSPLRSNFTIGILGAGQLARMSALQAFRFGFRVASYSDRASDEPLQWMTPLSRTGSFSDIDALIEFASHCDVLTLENEFIDSDVLHDVVRRSRKPLFPSPESFALIENKRIEKETFSSHGIPVAPFRVVTTEEEFRQFGEQHGWPFVLKSSKGGYDGYGNKVVKDVDEAVKAFDTLGGSKGHEILAEAFVPFERELAVQVARNATGSVVYPCCETIQTDQICTAVLSPAPVEERIRKEAEELARKAMEAIDGVGLFAFEFFLTKDGRLLLNESAPRPHNSGHYTIEGCITSQFENHVRAITGLPLGSTDLRCTSAVMINLLGTQNREAMTEHALESMREKDVHLHLYGKKTSRIGRKMGHLTVLNHDPSNSIATVYQRAKQLADRIEI